MKHVRRFSELGLHDVPLVGGKNASLGEMYSALTEKGVKVPNGFATTSDAYWHYIEYNQLTERINAALDKLHVDDVEALARTGVSIRNMITHGEMPEDLEAEIRTAYAELCSEYGDNTDVAVRSSATAEDLPTASFAGQQETYLNIRGDKNLISSCKRVFASLFTNRAISYRVHQGFDHKDVALSIGVQKMVRSDLAASGVMFTLDTESGFRDVVFITGAYGLGENVVQGTVNPDEFYVFKPTLALGKRPILKRQLGEKAIRMIYTGDSLAGMSTRNVDVKRVDRERFCLSDEEVLTLARYAVEIEKHYTGLAGQPRPMDIEWAKDGRTGELFIVQARPETVQSQIDSAYQETLQLKESGEVLVQGTSVGQRIATGPARVVVDASEMNRVRDGEILVTDITDPDWEPVMKRAAAIVTNRGGRTCHAAIIARELGIPAIVGCGDATLQIADGQSVTVSCAEGDTGNVYDGILHFEREKFDLRTLPRPKTKLMLNVGNPEQAFKYAYMPSDGVGLARLEFIINNSIRVHPRALLEYKSLPAEVQEEVDAATAGYPDRRAFYIERLAEGVSSIAAAFYPKPVIVRMSDFKSNEYASLIGGPQFEPEEENPMIGFRGAARYYSDSFHESFALECEALVNAREEKGLDNIAVMVPFTRSVDEARKVLEIMKQNGLERGKDGLKVYLMCELPVNALLADQFLTHFDGFSIGSNDLTQLTLGVDRDSGLLGGFDERNDAVLKLMELAIEACNAQGKYVGICGQAPSDFPEITRWLVEHGIQSISLNPDSLLTMIRTVVETEEALGR